MTILHEYSGGMDCADMNDHRLANLPVAVAAPVAVAVAEIPPQPSTALPPTVAVNLSQSRFSEEHVRMDSLRCRCQYCGENNATTRCFTCPPMADGNQPGLHAPPASGKEKFGAANWPCFDRYHDAAHRYHCKRDCAGLSFTMDPDVARMRAANKKRIAGPATSTSSFAALMSATKSAKNTE
jgi:hypothetical protein